MKTLSRCLFSTCKTSAKQAQNSKTNSTSVSQYQQIHGRLTRCSKRNSHDLQKVHMSDHLPIAHVSA
jgi:hypothetical protein